MPGSNLNSMFVLRFVEYLKDVLENSLFVLKTEADL